MKKDHFEDSSHSEFRVQQPVDDIDHNTPHCSHLNILLVEDSFADYDDICRIIRRMPHFTATIICARNLEEARQAISSQKFDIALVDYCLGAESGARFLHEIGGRGGAVASILLTGLMTKEPQEIAMQAGAVGCLSKDDLSPRLLETTIRYSLYTHMLEKKFRNVVERMSQQSSGSQQSPLP